MSKCMAPEDQLTDDQKAKFDEQFGDDGWALIQREDPKDPSRIKWQLAFRRPTAAEFQAFKARSAKSDSRAQEFMVRGALIHPHQDKLKQWIADGVCAAGIFDGKAVGDKLGELLDLTASDVEKG